MSVMVRCKKGDEVASCYGPYYEWNDVCTLKPGTVLDVLCNDGLHYHVDLKEIDKKTGLGVLHFCKWSKKYDWKGQHYYYYYYYYYYHYFYYHYNYYYYHHHPYYYYYYYY